MESRWSGATAAGATPLWGGARGAGATPLLCGTSRGTIPVRPHFRRSENSLSPFAAPMTLAPLPLVSLVHFPSVLDRIRSDRAYGPFASLPPLPWIQSVSCLNPVKCVTAVGPTYIRTRYENSFSIDGLHWYLAGHPNPRHMLIGRS